MRISRPCYDKYHRCPGWAGGGMRYAKRDRCPAGGSLARVVDYDSRRWRWRMHTCPECGVHVLPAVIRHIDPTWYAANLRHRVRMWWRYNRPWRKEP